MTVTEKRGKEKLHKKAEEIFQTESQVKTQSKEVDELIHNLRVHQIELEIQNEELRKAQIKLEDSQRKYFELYNFVSDGYFTLDKNGLILEVNLAGASLLGVERLILINASFIQYIDPEYRNKFNLHCMKVMETATKQTVEIKLLKNDKSSFFVYLDTLNVLDSSNEFKEFRISVRDITDIKNAAKEVELASNYNRSLLEASIDPLVTIGSNGNINDVNRSTEKITGITRDDLIGNDFSNYFTDPKRAREGYKQVFKEGSVLDYPLEIKHKNGHVTPVLYNASLYKDEFGEVLGVFAAARDITEIQRAEEILIDYHDTLEERVKKRTEDLAKSNADLAHFAYVASHDLREPLRMISSFLQLLERRYKDDLDEDANDFIGFAVEGAKRLDLMINDLLEYSKITQTELDFKPVKLEDVLEEALINLIVQTEENNAVITSDPLPTVIGDELLLVQLFQNLIVNAIKYRSQETPRIHVSSKMEKNQYLISVKDNGIGIDPKQLGRIFTIFQRLHRNDEYEGTGIGLAIAQNIINQHGGQIWAESEIGNGSIFYFTLPDKY